MAHGPEGPRRAGRCGRRAGAARSLRPTGLPGGPGPGRPARPADAYGLGADALSFSGAWPPGLTRFLCRMSAIQALQAIVGPLRSRSAPLARAASAPVEPAGWESTFLSSLLLEFLGRRRWWGESPSLHRRRRRRHTHGLGGRFILSCAALAGSGASLWTGPQLRCEEDEGSQ